MEQTDWVHQGFDSAQAQFLMVTAITHHRFSSPIWGEHEVQKLYAELAEIAASVTQVEAPRSSRWRITWPGIAVGIAVALLAYFPLINRPPSTSLPLRSRTGANIKR